MLRFLLYLLISLFLFTGQLSDRNTAAFSLSPLNLKGGHPVVCVCARAINTMRLVPSNTTRVSFIIMLKYFYKSNMFQPN
jgi:hypothetical protein